MVIVKVWGGLGNQLFQYSFGKWLAAKLNVVVKYDIQTTNSLGSFTQRDFALSFYNVHIDKANEAEVNEKKYFRNIQLARIERKLAQQFPAVFKKYFVEQNKPASVDSLQVRDNCYYEGYWQSYKYLIPVENMLRQELTLKDPLPVSAMAMLDNIKQTSSASIHVRRTDYVAHPHFETCSIEYYEKAISLIKSKQSNNLFYVFSDDMEWCRQHFAGDGFVFVEGNTHYEDLFLMSHCQHNIIANSSFSWWAAWLNRYAGKTVIAPARWHNKKDVAESELLPAEWMKVG